MGKKVLARGRGRWLALAASLVVSAAMVYAQGTEPRCCVQTPAVTPTATPTAPGSAAPASTPNIASPAEAESLAALAANAPAAAQPFQFPLPPGVASEDRLQVKTIWAARVISVLFPQITTIYGYRQDPLPWHPNGLAIDEDPELSHPRGHRARQPNRRVCLGECQAMGSEPCDLAAENLPGHRRAELDGELRKRNRQPLRPRSYRHQRRWIPNGARNLLHRIHEPYPTRVIYRSTRRHRSRRPGDAGRAATATSTRVWLTVVDEVCEESGQPASAKVIEPRPLRLDRDAHHLLVHRPHVSFELGEIGFLD